MDNALRYRVTFTLLSRYIDGDDELQKYVGKAKTYVREAFRESGMVTDEVIVRQESVTYAGSNRVFPVKVYVTEETIVHPESFEPDVLAEIVTDYLEEFDEEFFSGVSVVAEEDNLDYANFDRI